jgi:hypothetical protein
VGQAVLALSGRSELTWLSGPVGLGAILVVSGVAIELEGHATSVAATLGVLLLASAAVAAPRLRAPGKRALPALAAAALALLVASLPFIANLRVGILGVGLVNDDMAYHLLMADWLATRVGDMPVLLEQGYPVGPHALAAGLSEVLGSGLEDTFAGITLAIPVLTALVAYQALRGVGTAARMVAAALVAVPYLVAAYLAQEAFKEPIEALFLLSFALLLPTVKRPASAVPLGVLAAGAVYTYSFPGLFWLAGMAAVYAVLMLIGRAPAAPRGALWSGLAAAGVLLVLTAPEWARMVDFADFRAFSASNISEGLGNLGHHLSPLEALGIWPTSEFRLAASDAGQPVAFYAGAVVAAVALVVALPGWLRRNGPAVPAALAVAIAGYVGARAFGTVYTSAKALAIASPLIALIAFGGLLGRERVSAMPRSLAVAGLAVLLAVGMAVSSLAVLRQAPVAPTEHADQLAELRPLVQGERVLFLGRDNFVAYELRGSRPFTAVRNFYDPYYVRPNLRLEDVFRKFDFDSVTPATLGRFPYVITTRAAYASGPPPGFERAHQTADFVLWKRSGPVGPRRTLAEGPDPGAELECRRGNASERPRDGRATIFAPAPVVGGTWSPGSTVEDGSPVTQMLDLPAGRWAISLQYDSTRPVRVSAKAYAHTLPANLDYRGSVPYYPAGELVTDRAGRVRFTVEVKRPPLTGRLLGTKSQAHLGAIAASPAGSGGPIPGVGESVVPVARACGEYVDWYAPTPGP